MTGTACGGCESLLLGRSVKDTPCRGSQVGAEFIHRLDFVCFAVLRPQCLFVQPSALNGRIWVQCYRRFVTPHRLFPWLCIDAVWPSEPHNEAAPDPPANSQVRNALLCTALCHTVVLLGKESVLCCVSCYHTRDLSCPNIWVCCV